MACIIMLVQNIMQLLANSNLNYQPIPFFKYQTIQIISHIISPRIIIYPQTIFQTQYFYSQRINNNPFIKLSNHHQISITALLLLLLKKVSSARL